MGRGQAATASRGDLRTGWHRQLAALGSSRGSLSPGPAPPAGSWILLARVDLRVLCPQPCTQLWASESRAIPSKGETYWGLPFPSKTKAPGQRGRKGTQLRMWPSPRLPAGRPDVSWPLLPLYRGLLGVRNTGVGACRCPTLKDHPPPGKSGPLPSSAPITRGGQASQTAVGAPYTAALGTGLPGAGCSPGP